MGTRNHLHLPNHACFVTTVTRDRASLFDDHEAAEAFVEALMDVREELAILVLSFVVMPDHVHLLLVPTEEARLPRIMQLVKGRFAYQWNLRTRGAGSLWESRYYESMVRSLELLRRWVEYIHYNPVKARFVETAEDYRWSSASGLFPTDLNEYLNGRTVEPG